MPCVNRLSDFHSDGSGIGPTPPLSGKATPASLFLKAPRALLSSPISCLNYALLCAVVVFFFLPSSSPASPSSSLDPSSPPYSLSVSHSFLWRDEDQDFEVWSLLQGPSLAVPHHHLPPHPSSPSPFHRLSTWKGILCFRCIKGLALSTGWIHQGPWKTYSELQLQFLWKGREEEEEEGWWVSEGGRQLEGITVQFHRQHNYKHTKC